MFCVTQVLIIQHVPVFPKTVNTSLILKKNNGLSLYEWIIHLHKLFNFDKSRFKNHKKSIDKEIIFYLRPSK